MPAHPLPGKPTVNSKVVIMKRIQKFVLSLFMVLAAGSLFTGCRTAHGFGEDMENAGQSIKDHVD